MSMSVNFAHGGLVRSATMSLGELVVFDLPDRHAGAPGTVSAADSADWTESDWATLARSRQREVRRRQSRAGLAGPRSRMSDEYAREALRERGRSRPAWSVVRSDEPGDVYAAVFYGSTEVERWRRERVPGMGPGAVWSCYPAGHAHPVGYASEPPA